MKICLCTLVLNEMEWLPRLYQQHIGWSGLVRWVFVESADRVYASSNPSMVTSSGLSVDGTTEFLEELASKDKTVTHIKLGFSEHTDPAQGKCASRTAYLNAIAEDRPDFLIVLDADEFYTYQAQSDINRMLSIRPRYYGFIFKHRDIWRPASIADQPLFDLEVTGGFWDIPYCRVWRWMPGLEYKRNHNTPECRGEFLDRYQLRFDKRQNMPEFIHMGFACDPKIRAAKNKYYADRGERADTKRSWYVISRDAFETWKPGNFMPYKSKIVPYTGPIPECFQ
jgi:hypothetical protein